MENVLYYGDNLDILKNKVPDSTVDLCYIDPPFKSNRNYNQIYKNIGTDNSAQSQAFIDTWTWEYAAEKQYESILVKDRSEFTSDTLLLVEALANILGKGSMLAYLVSMTTRINLIQKKLKDTGSFFLHCDPSASHYLKLLCDTIFIPRGGDFKNEIVWERTTDTGSSKAIANKYPINHDIILFYWKSEKSKFFKQYYEYSEEYIVKKFTEKDEKGIFRWQVLKTYSEETFAKLKAENALKKTAESKYYYYKQYLKDSKGVRISDVWNSEDIPPLSPKSTESLGYPTQKPEKLLQRIIEASTDEGDVVMDCFCGCGTAIVAAEELNRKWIGVDITYQSISLIIKRLGDSFGDSCHYKVDGIPKDFASAEALAIGSKHRKEFEKWAVLTFTNNLAIINEKTGADQGIDGRAFIHSIEGKKIVLFSVKSGTNISTRDVRDLLGVIEREKAEKGYLITLYDAKQTMYQEAAKAGRFLSKALNRELDKISIVTATDILKGARIDLPISFAVEVTKKAQQGIAKAKQKKLF